MNIKRSLAVLLALAATAALLASGCAPAATPSPTPIRTLTPSITVSPSVTPMTTPAETPATTPEATLGAMLTGDEAAKIAAEVDKLSEIEKSAVVVSGGDALVGVVFAAQYQGEMTDRLKDMIVEKVKEADSRITAVAVTADSQLYARIAEMFDNLKNGVTANLSGEFTEIFNQVSPKVS